MTWETMLLVIMCCQLWGVLVNAIMLLTTTTSVRRLTRKTESMVDRAEGEMGEGEEWKR